MTETAYDRVVKQKLVIAQAEQRATAPAKIGQKIFHDWCKSHGAVVDVHVAADLVRHIEAAIIAERAAPTGKQTP